MWPKFWQFYHWVESVLALNGLISITLFVRVVDLNISCDPCETVPVTRSMGKKTAFVLTNYMPSSEQSSCSDGHRCLLWTTSSPCLSAALSGWPVLASLQSWASCSTGHWTGNAAWADKSRGATWLCLQWEPCVNRVRNSLFPRFWTSSLFWVYV